jgi:hypothetical protein
MAQTHDIGNLYWHAIKYNAKPKEFFEKAESQEIEPPFRTGKGFAIRFPFSKRGLVFGWWKKSGFEESQALTYAVNGRGLTKNEVDWDHIRYGAKNEDTVKKA